MKFSLNGFFKLWISNFCSNCWSTILAPGVGNGNTIPYSMDKGACQVVVHGVAESPTWLSNWTHPSSIESLWQICQNLVGCSWYSTPFHGLGTSSSANTTHSWLLLLYNMSWDSIVILPVLFCFLKTVIATPVPLPFHNNFRRALCISTKDLPGIMITTELKLCFNLERNDLSTILSLSIKGHGCPCHFS